jgi:hypothetical protein
MSRCLPRRCQLRTGQSHNGAPTGSSPIDLRITTGPAAADPPGLHRRRAPGEEPHLLLRPINRIGHRIRAGQGRAPIERRTFTTPSSTRKAPHSLGAEAATSGGRSCYDVRAPGCASYRRDPAPAASDFGSRPVLPSAARLQWAMFRPVSAAAFFAIADLRMPTGRCGR